MSFKTFLDLVEIQTKIASLFPFLIGILFVAYRYESINVLNSMVFFGSMLIFDLTTTAINNYMDYRKATDNHDYDYRKERNIIGRAAISETLVVVVIWTMLITAVGLGLYLVYLTNIIVLIMGLMCFFIGIFYTFGPLPLSRLPLGEVFSGVTMGFGIIFLVIYINVYNLDIISLHWSGYTISFHVNLQEVFWIVLISLPSVFTIANLMMANNICDLEEDIRNDRFTLPYYIGKKAAVKLFEVLYIVSFSVIILAVALKVYHPIMLLALVVLIPVLKNVRLFKAKQIKSKTFIVSVKNLILTNGAIVVGLLLSLLLVKFT